MIHKHLTHDGRKIYYDDVTKIPRAYVLRAGQWVRVSMKTIMNQILLKELLEKIANPPPKLEGVIRQIRKENESDRV